MKRAALTCARVVVPALLAAVVMTAAEHLAGTAPIRSAVQPTSIVWSGRVFTSKTTFAQWLRARGASYDTWARIHPALAEAQNSHPTEGTAEAASAAQSNNPDHNHLLALAVAVFVALVLILVLWYHRTTYDFRGRLQRSPPKFAIATARVAGGGDGLPALPRPPNPASALRRRFLRSASAVAKTIVLGTGPAAGSLLRLPSRSQTWLRTVRQHHPELTWYAAACAFATAVGIIVPFLVR